MVADPWRRSRRRKAREPFGGFERRHSVRRAASTKCRECTAGQRRPVPARRRNFAALPIVADDPVRRLRKVRRITRSAGVAVFLSFIVRHCQRSEYQFESGLGIVPPSLRASVLVITVADIVHLKTGRSPARRTRRYTSRILGGWPRKRPGRPCAKHGGGALPWSSTVCFAAGGALRVLAVAGRNRRRDNARMRLVTATSPGSADLRIYYTACTESRGTPRRRDSCCRARKALRQGHVRPTFAGAAARPATRRCRRHGAVLQRSGA